MDCEEKKGHFIMKECILTQSGVNGILIGTNVTPNAIDAVKCNVWYVQCRECIRKSRLPLSEQNGSAVI